MVIDDKFKQELARLARYNHTPKEIFIMLDVPKYMWAELTEEIENDDSELYALYTKGRLHAAQDIDDALENMINEGADGAGDAAKALTYRQKKRGYSQLKHDLFGLWIN